MIDPEKWSGSLPASPGIAPRIRVGRSKWFSLLWLLPIGFALLRRAPLAQMRYHLTMLAYDMDGEPLSYGHEFFGYIHTI